MTSASSVGSAVVGTHATSYDAVGRVASETDPLGNTAHYVYDLRGMLRRLTNPLGQILEQDCNAHGEIVGQRMSGVETRWTYDAAGRANAFIDPTGQVLRFGFDARDKVSDVVRPDGARQTYRYEPNGALREFVDYDGTVLEYTNDSNGLPLTITAAPAAGVVATPDLQLEYDGARRIARASYGGVTHLFQYDSLGRRLAEAGPDLVRMSYDAAGLTRRLTYPDGRRDRHEHDPRGRLLRVVLEANAPVRQGSLNDGATVAEFGWFGADRLERVRTAGTDTVLRYDVADRLIEQSVTGAAGAVVHRQDWFLDALGQRRGEALRAGPNMAREHQFDALTRLTRARVGLAINSLPGSAVGLTQVQINAAIGALAGAAGNGDIAWSYFPNDTPERRTERNGTGQLVSTRVFTTNTLHQVTSVNGAAITYGGSGNLTGRGTRTYRYDAYRRLVAVEEGGATVTTIQYDGLGRMHQLSTPGGTQRLACWEDELLQVSGVNAMQLTPGPLLDRAVSASVGSSTFGLITDGIGSLVVACDQAGRVVERYIYEFFGAPTILAPDGTRVRANSSIGLIPRFQGRPWLGGARLYDFRNRSYDPELQVFLQPDPFALSGSWGPYGFCRFNPVDYVDPYGLFWHIVIGAAVGAAIGGISTAIHGGDWRDILVASGAGAVGGAFTAAGMPMLGAAAA
ncbi:MAG TPA: RHS repeat-associated core domain-containing protein, partial [Polyangiaceae bacterium]